LLTEQEGEKFKQYSSNAHLLPKQIKRSKELKIVFPKLIFFIFLHGNKRKNNLPKLWAFQYSFLSRNDYSKIYFRLAKSESRIRINS